MSEMTMRERIARALAGVMFQSGDYEDVPVDHVFVRPRYTHLAAAAYGAADAVLDVLAEPDEGMIEAFFECNAAAKTVFADPADLWRAMLDAARTPGAIEETGVRG